VHDNNPTVILGDVQLSKSCVDAINAVQKMSFILDPGKTNVFKAGSELYAL
tara:strand:- start:233 stop:385 length:153 start_codon:yes stop_codon:yes gene_type:complete